MVRQVMDDERENLSWQEFGDASLGDGQPGQSSP